MIIKIKDPYKDYLPEQYHEISKDFDSQDECKIHADRLVTYLSNFLT